MRSRLDDLSERRTAEGERRALPGQEGSRCAMARTDRVWARTTMWRSSGPCSTRWCTFGDVELFSRSAAVDELGGRENDIEDVLR